MESLLASLALVFVAELGDKTQLVALGFGAWTLRERDADAGDEADAVGEGGVATDRRSIVLSVAGAMFVAELGDKTMLATATLAAQGSPVNTGVGATVGIILSGALGVLLGRVFGARLPERITRLGSAALFALFGAVLLVANL